MTVPESEQSEADSERKKQIMFFQLAVLSTFLHSSAFLEQL